MSWFSNKKESERLPDLPELPELPSVTTVQMQKPSQFSLPPLPEPRLGINTERFMPPKANLDNTNISTSSSNFSTSNMQKSEFPKSFIDEAISNIEPKKAEVVLQKPIVSAPAAPVVKKNEPIFIRLDKFETTVENFSVIKEKISEIEDLLNKTKEIRAKEDEEISKWEKEIQMIKSRIDSIDKSLLDRI